MDGVAVVDRPVADHSARPRAYVVASRVAAVAVTVLCSATVIVLVLDARTGLDLTDEGLYLLAADNSQPMAAANGWFGAYTAVLFTAVGHDIALFRVAGVAILLACGALLGTGVRSVVRLEGVDLTASSTYAIIVGAAAGELAFYGLYLRTPGYNWLALTGATLAAAGMLLQIATRPRDGPAYAILVGLLIGIGCSLALWAKSPTGLGLAALAFVVAVAPIGANRRERARGGLAAAGVAGILLALHFAMVADPATTVAVLRRSAGWLAIVDPDWYPPLAALRHAAVALALTPWWVASLTVGLVLLALAPLALMANRGRSSPLPTVATAMAAIAVVGVFLLWRGQWVGGVDALQRIGLADVSLLMTAFVAALASSIVARWRWNEAAPGVFRLLSAAAVSIAAAMLYAFGSNNGIDAQLSLAGGLVFAAAALCGLACVPRRWGAPVLVGFAVAAAGVSLLSVGTARMNPYRMASPDAPSAMIEFGQRAQRLNVDLAAAAFWEALQTGASRAGWQAGTRLLDLTWDPAVPYALAATVPETLFACLQGDTATASAIEALRLSDAPAWRDAWVLVSPALEGPRPAEILATAGRRFPDDYSLVLRLVVPDSKLPIELWRPSTP